MEKYEVINQIGHGNFGKIYKIKRKSDNKILIWKELDYSHMTEKEKEQIVTEVNILRELNHPNIVKYYDRIIDKKNSKIYIIMEYCEGGDISQLISKCKKNGEYISEEMLWKIFTQILKAVHAIHTHKSGIILHRDIKPSNIFLDKNNNIKLGDFGLSRLLPPELNFAYSRVGTPYYMSPEQIDETKYNEKSDIWSLGCLLYEMAAFRPPFQAKNQIMLGMKIKSGKIERINKRYSNDLWKCICSMMNINYEKRPSTKELMKIKEIDVRIKEEEIEELYECIKILEEKLKKKEVELNMKEKELNERENKLNEIEKNYLLKESELNEKEKYLIELEKKLKMSTTSTWFSNSRLKSSENSELNNNNIILNPNLNSNQNFNSQSLNELDNFLIYTNHNNNNIYPQKKIKLSTENKLSKTSNIFLSLENIVNTHNYTNRANLNTINKKQNLIQSKSVTNCFSSLKNIENIDDKIYQMNKSNTLENSQKIDQNIMPIFSPINSSKNKVVINFNTNMRNKPKNISTIDNAILTNTNSNKIIHNNISNLINYSSLLSHMNTTKIKNHTINFNTNINTKKNLEEQKNNNELNITNNTKQILFSPLSRNNTSNYNRRTINKISLIKNTKKNLNKLLHHTSKRSHTPRMNKIPTKLEYKDNITYSNYVYNSKLCNKKNDINKSECVNSYGNFLTNAQRQNKLNKDSASLKSCVNLKKDLKNADKKNITTYRSNSSFNILKKAS